MGAARIRREPSASAPTATLELPTRASEVGELEQVASGGELVQVRSRRCVVEEVLPPPKPGQSCRVRMACADDDAQGQSLEVFWDFELDRRILKEEGWADLASRGFDPPRHFAAFLHTLRWNCVTATNPNLFQAPFRAGIRIDAYQMEPLRKALRLPRVSLFIADDTGLGKTIEAGLIARELLLRKKAKVNVVAAPPSVLEQWKADWVVYAPHMQALAERFDPAELLTRIVLPESISKVLGQGAGVTLQNLTLNNLLMMVLGSPALVD